MSAAINHYEIFLKTAELGNITKAAEVLNFTQSGVSHAIAALEKEAGVALFARGKNGVSLTENGKRLLAPIQALVNQQRNLAQAIHEVSGLVAGTLRVGTFTSVSAQWLPHVIKSFRERYPQVEFELRAGDYDEITAWIMQGKIDCGFLTAPANEDLFFLPLRKDPMLALLPVGHPLAAKKRLTLKELIREPFIVPMKGSDNDIRAVLRQAPGRPAERYTLNDDFSVMSMVEHGFGITIMAELILRNFTYRLEARPLEPPQFRTIGIASLPLNEISVLSRTFIQYLQNADDLDFENL